MSCCQGNQNENTEYYVDPTNYDVQGNTYVLQNQYYAPPMPGQRTEYDMNMRKTFNPIDKPDFLNFANKEQYVYIYNADGNVDQGVTPGPGPFTARPFTPGPFPFTTTRPPLGTFTPGPFPFPFTTTKPPLGTFTPGVGPFVTPLVTKYPFIPGVATINPVTPGPGLVNPILPGLVEPKVPILTRNAKSNRKSLLAGQYYS